MRWLEPRLFIHCRLASIYFVLNRQEEAVAECRKAVDLRPENVYQSVLRAGLLLLADRPDLYAETCADAFDHFAQEESSEDRMYVARCCVLAPGAVADPMETVRLANLCVEDQPHTHWFLHTLGMAHVRAGQSDEAEQRFKESLDVAPNWPAKHLNYLGMAFVHHGRGNLEQARQSYAKAVEQIDGRPANYTRRCEDWLESHILRRELERLLEISD